MPRQDKNHDRAGTLMYESGASLAWVYQKIQIFVKILS